MSNVRQERKRNERGGSREERKEQGGEAQVKRTSGPPSPSPQFGSVSPPPPPMQPRTTKAKAPATRRSSKRIRGQEVSDTVLSIGEEEE